MSLPRIQFQEDFTSILPATRLGLWQANLKVTPSGPDILHWMEKTIEDIHAKYTIEEISSIPIISDTRNAYRKAGKDPSRYRPSAEALCRRIAGGKPLFHVNNAVDILNTISIQSGFSIGGYDFDKIDGNISLGIGKDGEPYHAIGRGELNMQGLPILRDRLGPFGSPTSDSIRTMVTESTTRVLMVFFDFSGKGDLGKVLESASGYYRNFTGAENISFIIQNA